MFEENDRNFEERDREEMVNRYEDMLRKKKPLFFDIDDFESIIDFYVDQNKISRALEATRIASGLFPASPEIMLRKAQLLIDKGKTNEAISELKNALSIDQDNFEIYLMLGIASLQINKIKESICYFDNCINRIYEGVRKDDILFSIGFHLGHAGKYSLALKYLFRSVEMNPDNTDSISEIAYCYDGLSQYNKSIEYYNKFLDKDAFAEHIWYNLGLIYIKTGENDKAIESFDYALAIDPSYLSAYLAKANIFLNLEKYHEAIKIYETYLEFDSGYNDIYYYIGECYEKLEKLDLATEYYELTVKNNDKHTEAWLGLGIIKMFLEDYSKSLIYLNKAINLEPLHPEARYSLAELYLKKGNYREGLKHIEIAINSAPSEVDYFLLQSELYYALKQFESSISVLEKGLETIDEKAPVYYRLAGLLINLEPSPKAVDYLKMAIETDNTLILDFLRIFPEAKDFTGFKGLLNLSDKKI